MIIACYIIDHVYYYVNLQKLTMYFKSMTISRQNSSGLKSRQVGLDLFSLADLSNALASLLGMLG